MAAALVEYIWGGVLGDGAFERIRHGTCSVDLSKFGQAVDVELASPGGYG